jgi:hypothetical protein
MVAVPKKNGKTPTYSSLVILVGKWKYRVVAMYYVES